MPETMKRLLFIDRDGTILREPEDEQIDALPKFAFVPGALRYLPIIADKTDYLLLMVSNQDGLGTAAYPTTAFEPYQQLMLDTLEGIGVHFADVLIDCTTPKQGAATRKPGTAMLRKYIEGDYNLSQSYVIGDRDTDRRLAAAIGCKFIGINQDEPDSWRRAADTLLHGERQAHVHRKTLETDIEVLLDLNGQGTSQIETGIGFLDHMLSQIPRHALIDLQLRAKGDLHVDSHHTIEDTAITLGEALAQALTDRRGIERYAFTLPMDDALASVAIDLGGRADLIWNLNFTRETIGGVPTEAWKHFFKSLSEAAKCNIAVEAHGENNHHLIEAIFKAFARALRAAIRRDPLSNQLPSSKGVI